MEETSESENPVSVSPQTPSASHTDALWQSLKSALENILRKDCCGLSSEELHRAVQAMVLDREGRRLYQGTRRVVARHLEQEVRPPLFAFDSFGGCTRKSLRDFASHFSLRSAFDKIDFKEESCWPFIENLAERLQKRLSTRFKSRFPLR